LKEFSEVKDVQSSYIERFFCIMKEIDCDQFKLTIVLNGVEVYSINFYYRSHIIGFL